ncbi:hypothetical protein CU008_0945 [Enterococcus faecium]|nr:hypothetical protein [Enterococcus faecium]MBK4842373.1 hypothetical protein [Enterococcus faecium]
MLGKVVKREKTGILFIDFSGKSQYFIFIHLYKGHYICKKKKHF